MERRPVESSAIVSVGYDGGTSVLEIEFRDGGVYRYFLVPPSVFRALMAAESVGNEFQVRVRDRYRFERIE